MKIINAKDIWDKVEFNNYEDFNTYPKTIYKCSNCEEEITFVMQDLNKHSFSKHTNLTKKESEEFQKFIEQCDINEFNSFIDFNCPKCKRPVRILYQSWGGGRHGESGFILNYLVE